MRSRASSRDVPPSPNALGAWEQEIGPLLDATEAAALLTDDWPRMQPGQLIELRTTSGHLVYPAWQFAANGRVLDALVAVYRLLVDDGGLSPWAAASYCVSADDRLDGLSPRDWLAAGHAALRVRLIAEQDAARFAQ